MTQTLIKLLSEDDDLNDEKLAKICKINLYSPVSELADSYTTNKKYRQSKYLFIFQDLCRSEREISF